jgi:surface polysaccharide O-acyltransferase-like enzyme
MQSPPESTPEPDAREPLEWVTWLRVIAILGVVSIHNAAPNASAPGARSTLVGNVAIALDLAFIFAVPLFVMLSGTLLLDPRGFRSSSAFIEKRGLRVVPPLLFWHIFYVVFNGVLSGIRPGVGKLTRDVVTGKVAVHLYFFWIILGLALLTPVLVRWVAATGRREWLVGGLLATTVPVLTAMTTELRDEPMTFVHTAWTWWVPYLGVFILGWALRGVVLRGPVLVAAVVLALGLVVEIVWQWRNPAAPDWLHAIAPVNYYGPTVTLLTVLVFLVGQAGQRRRGAVGEPRRRGVRRPMDELGAATLGIFALHLAVLQLTIEWEWFGPAATSAQLLLLRYAVVLAITVAIVLPLRRVPYVRAVL